MFLQVKKLGLPNRDVSRRVHKDVMMVSLFILRIKVYLHILKTDIIKTDFMRDL